MKRGVIYVLLLWTIASSCGDDAEITTSIVGKWQGEQANLKIKPDGFPVAIPYTATFTSIMEFQTDGTLVLTENGKSATGTYHQAGNKLTINVGFVINDVDLSGTYTIVELTHSALKAEIEKQQTVKDPSTQTDVSGKVEATLRFKRI